MLMIRVAAAILFSALALWSQTPESDRNKELCGTDSQTSVAPDSLNANPLDSAEAHPIYRFSLELDKPHLFNPKPSEFKLAALSVPLFLADPAQSTAPKKPFSLSKGYFTRRKIHKYASLATLPLLTAEAVVGQKLLDESDSESSSLRSAHSGLAAGIGVLFGTETITGIWNMLESRKAAPVNRKRLFHGVLMLIADAGFIATAATAPHREDERGGREGGDVSTHRAIAYTSIGIAAFSYLYMLISK